MEVINIEKSILATAGALSVVSGVMSYKGGDTATGSRLFTLGWLLIPLSIALKRDRDAFDGPVAFDQERAMYAAAAAAATYIGAVMSRQSLDRGQSSMPAAFLFVLGWAGIAYAVALKSSPRKRSLAVAGAAMIASGALIKGMDELKGKPPAMHAKTLFILGWLLLALSIGLKS